MTGGSHLKGPVMWKMFPSDYVTMEKTYKHSTDITLLCYRVKQVILNLHLHLSSLPEASFGLRVLSSPASVCVSVCVCVNHLLVRAITWDLFKLGSPNLDQRCKRPWLRSLLFWGAIDLDLQGQI